MKKLLIPLIFILSSGCASSSPTASFLKQDSLTQEIDQLIQDDSVRPFNGVVLISKGDEILYQRAQGFADFEERTPLTMSDTFRIQSNSKQITAVLVLKEVERGSVNLDSPISEYLPSLEQEWSNQVTVHHLLNMTSGITGLEDDLAFEPGTDFYYSNPGYGLLGAILESVTGKTYSVLANELFAELGMKDTHPYIWEGQNDLVAGHGGTKDEIEKTYITDLPFDEDSWKRFIPTGGILSTASDLKIWDTKLHNGQLLSSSSYEAMIRYSITAPHAAFGSDILGYGYGVRIYDAGENTHIGHGGRGIGFANIKIYFPEHQLSVIVLENVYITDDTGSPATVYHFEREIRNAVLENIR